MASSTLSLDRYYLLWFGLRYASKWQGAEAEAKAICSRLHQLPRKKDSVRCHRRRPALHEMHRLGKSQRLRVY
jgi:phage gp46-like protein